MSTQEKRPAELSRLRSAPSDEDRAPTLQSFVRACLATEDEYTPEFCLWLAAHMPEHLCQ